MRVGEIEAEWMVGLCEGPTSRGTLQVAKWLASHSEHEHWGVRGVHVLGRGPDRTSVLPGHATRRARNRIAELITEVEAAESLEGVEFVDAPNPEEGLCKIAAADGIHGLIIGRSTRSDPESAVRLGRTVRRLLDRCKAPVIVAGPELDPELLESGPIVVGVRLSDRCAKAAMWAQRLARSLDRPLEIVHVVEVPTTVALELGVHDEVRGRIAEKLWRRQQALRLWCIEHGLDDASVVAVLGSAAAECLLTHAAAVGACAIVCSSREPDPGHVRSRSVSTELVARSRWPVAVVPCAEDQASIPRQPLIERDSRALPMALHV